MPAHLLQSAQDIMLVNTQRAPRIGLEVLLMQTRRLKGCPEDILLLYIAIGAYAHSELCICFTQISCITDGHAHCSQSALHVG